MDVLWTQGKASIREIQETFPEKHRPAYNTIQTTVYRLETKKAVRPGKGIIRQRLMFTPGSFFAQNFSLLEIIRAAYGVDDYQISTGTNSLTSMLYDVDAKVDNSVIVEMQKLSDAQRDLENPRMLQALLADKFQLTVHLETKELPIYSLVVVEPGKLHEAAGDCGPNPVIVQPGMSLPPPPCGSLRISFDGGLDGHKATTKELAFHLSRFTKRMVLDETNLTGTYDINLQWTPESGQFPPLPAGIAPSGPPAAAQPDPNRPLLLTPVQQQLGLRLEPHTAPVEILLIDHVEPLANQQVQGHAPLSYEDTSIKLNNSGRPLTAILTKPDRLTVINFTLHRLILSAYGVQDDQISGGPSWLNSEKYDIEEKINQSAMDALQQLSAEQRFQERKRMLQALLSQRGLAGKYDFVLQWDPSVIPPPTASSSGPSIITAVQQQLGLRLESQKGPVEVLVIDRAQQPMEN